MTTMTMAEKIVNRMTTIQSLLSGVLQDCVPEQAMLSVPVTGMSMDSRRLQRGDLFIACFGRNHDARDYIGSAIENGAAAVLAQAGGDWRESHWQGPVPVLVLDSLVAQISGIAARYYGEPASNLEVTGVTGTNGKTSCTQFLAQALTLTGESCGVIGTLGAGLYPVLDDTGYTTPGPVDVQHHLYDFVSGGTRYAVIEASSQGLHQHRLAAVPFRTAIFTNLTRDHLDYHDSMDAYGEAKKRLFLGEALRTAVVNTDDPYGVSILNALPSRVRALTYSVSGGRADVGVSRLEYLPTGYRAQLTTPWGEAELEGSLLGRFNISNMLAVLCALMSMPSRDESERDLFAIIGVLASLKPVSGRMEVVGQAAGVTAVVDYAHTPDALKSALAALRCHADGAVHCVFGCGGNRDQGKRPMMAEVAEQGADHLVITDDNPRLEDADHIIRQILLGLDDRDGAVVERDRAEAIRKAILGARPGDVVLVAGKGHENYQDVGGQRMAFSDVAQVRLVLNERAALQEGMPE
jgi:UDP-N-acetylmuramoyl-L-alanyl-D-glutamate--2,6-diaminopimelate ligase